MTRVINHPQVVSFSGAEKKTRSQKGTTMAEKLKSSESQKSGGAYQNEIKITPRIYSTGREGRPAASWNKRIFGQGGGGHLVKSLGKKTPKKGKKGWKQGRGGKKKWQRRGDFWQLRKGK